MQEFRKAIIVTTLISLVLGFVGGGVASYAMLKLPAATIDRFLGHLTPQRVGDMITPSTAETPSVPRPPATDEEAATIAAVRKVSPSVVSVVISKEVSTQGSQSMFPNDLFRQFGFEIPAPQQNPTPGPTVHQQVGGGSGFIITSDGMVVTNKHVVSDASADYTVVTSDNKEYKATVLARDPFIDLAFLKIDAKNLPTVQLGNSDTLRLGETVVAIGNALAEFSNSVTKGVVSGSNRRIVAGSPGEGSEVIEEAIQTDAAINPGNSGGPLINLRGEVIGVNAAVSQAGQSLGFAIPINATKAAIDSIKSSGRIIRPWIGVRYTVITAEMAKANQLPVDYGALVSRGDTQGQLAVVPGSPADKAGIVENDIILEVDHAKITMENSLGRIVQKKKPGDVVSLKVLSKGKEKEVRVTLEELKQ